MPTFVQTKQLDDCHSGIPSFLVTNLFSMNFQNVNVFFNPDKLDNPHCTFEGWRWLSKIGISFNYAIPTQTHG